MISVFRKIVIWFYNFKCIKGNFVFNVKSKNYSLLHGPMDKQNSFSVANKIDGSDRTQRVCRFIPSLFYLQYLCVITLRWVYRLGWSDWKIAGSTPSWVFLSLTKPTNIMFILVVDKINNNILFSEKRVRTCHVYCILLVFIHGKIWQMRMKDNVVCQMTH